MRTLIYSGVCSQSEENRDIVKLWGRLTTHLNPDIDIIVFNSLSPFDPEYFLPKNIAIHNFPDNPGHLSRGGKDGAGRTFCAGMEYAHRKGYDYCVHLESDLLLARPVQPIINAMHKAGVKAAGCYLTQYQFYEWGLSAFNVRYLADTNFVGRYDWENRVFPPIPEVVIETLLGDDLFLLPLRGLRNDQNQVNAHTLRMAYPYGPPDFMTRIGLDIAAKFLEWNSVVLPEEA